MQRLPDSGSGAGRESPLPDDQLPTQCAVTHLLEVGRLGGPTDRLSADTLEDAVAYLRRRTGRPDSDVLARLAWAGGQVQIGTLRVRGWTRLNVPKPCPHCGQLAYPRAVTCRDELDEAGLSEGLPPDAQVAILGFVFPAAECPACFENVTFPRCWPVGP